jgi:hypothetical protein
VKEGFMATGDLFFWSLIFEMTLCLFWEKQKLLSWGDFLTPMIFFNWDIVDVLDISEVFLNCS